MMSRYTEIANSKSKIQNRMSELFIKQELFKTLPQLDAVLLDVDGVILDVSQSFRVTIARTVQYIATEVLKLEDTGALIEESESDLFKMAGGFNSDWDLTNAAVALVIAKHARSGANTTSEIREQAPTWEQYTGEVKRRGGGLPAAEMVILEQLTPGQRRDFAVNWNPKFVTQIFQEMYGGIDGCKSLYGFEPEHLREEGLYKNEQVLLDRELITSLPSRVKVGLLTGRTRSETKLAMEFARLQIPESNWVTETDGVKKPDGAALVALQEKMNFKFGVYIGDTMDDLSVVKNYRETRGAGRAKIVSCIALSGPSGEAHRRTFLEAGTEIATPDVNTFLQYLKSVLK
jgi:HAD superfamily hydrolase (TIGR01548 family)